MVATELPVARRWAVGALLILTGVTGLIDALSYLGLGRVFVANMTGNVVFLGFALSPASGFSAIPSVAAIVGFLLGSVLGGRLGHRLEHNPRPWLATAFGIQALVLLIGALLAALDVLKSGGGSVRSWVFIAVLGACFGLQNSTVRRLAPRDLTTTVLTLTLTGLAADSVLGGGADAKLPRRLGSVVAMFAGAAIGAVLVRVSFSGVLALAGVLVTVAALMFAFAPEHG